MAYPITFHSQIRNDVASQETANDLRTFFGRSEVIAALQDSGVVQFARLLLIPSSRETAGIEGVFAIQVIIVYDGDIDGVLQSFWNAVPLRSLFTVISSIAVRPAETLMDSESFRRYVQDNNLNKKSKELRNAYRLTIDDIRLAFGDKPI